MRRRTLVPFLVLLMVAAGCASSDGTALTPEATSPAAAEKAAAVDPTAVPEPTDAPEPAAVPDPTSTPEPTALPASTSTPEPAERDAPPTFIVAPDRCLIAAELPGFDNPNGFVLVPEADLFDCLGIDSFRSIASVDGVIDVDQTQISVQSEQIRVDGSVSANALVSLDGDVIEQDIRIGAQIWSRPTTDGAWALGAPGLDQLFGEVGELRLTLGGALLLTALLYGGGAVNAGEVELNGRTVTLWEADAANIEAHVNALGFAPAPVGLSKGFVRIWTTDERLVVKIEGSLRAADVTLAGVPVTDLDPVSLGLDEDAFDIIPDFDVLFELSDYDEEVIVEAPL